MKYIIVATMIATLVTLPHSGEARQAPRTVDFNKLQEIIR